MDGIMKVNFKDIAYFLLIPLMIFIVVKIFWVSLETFVLPKSGTNHTQVVEIKPLYYNIKLIKKQKQKRKKTIMKKQNLTNIKDIQLIGIYADSDNVVITVSYKGKTKVLSKGDTINGFKLIAGAKDFAVFEKNNKQYKVDLLKSKIKQNNSIKITETKNSIPVQKSKNDDIVDKGDYKVINRKLFDHFANNMDDIYKNIGIQEIKKSNKKEFKISFVRRGSPFAKLGIKRGDIIKSINGQEIDSYGAALRVYGSIKDANMLTVVVIRNNQELELEYEIN